MISRIKTITSHTIEPAITPIKINLASSFKAFPKSHSSFLYKAMFDSRKTIRKAQAFNPDFSEFSIVMSVDVYDSSLELVVVPTEY